MHLVHLRNCQYWTALGRETECVYLSLHLCECSNMGIAIFMLEIACVPLLFSFCTDSLLILFQCAGSKVTCE